MTRVKVKICGIMSRDDVTAAVAARPDWAGFVLAPGRHRLTPEQVVELTRLLPPDLPAVGVWVNPDPEEVVDLVRRAGLSVVQLHGAETPEQAARLRHRLGAGVSVWKAVGLDGTDAPDRIRSYRDSVDALLLDAGKMAAPDGGSGRRVNWARAREAVRQSPVPVVLAGGLDPGCVAEAIHAVRPWAVDASSGVETGGIKDAEKMARLVREATAAVPEDR